MVNEAGLTGWVGKKLENQEKLDNWISESEFCKYTKINVKFILCGKGSYFYKVTNKNILPR